MPTTTPTRCRHLHTDGRQCGSPALRGEPLCFHHTTLRRPIPVKTLDGRTHPQLPAPDDFLAIQRSIAEVLRLLAHDELTDRRAATLLRGLANASQNLARHRRDERAASRLHQAAGISAEPVTDCINDPALGTIAVPEPQPELLPTAGNDASVSAVIPGEANDPEACQPDDPRIPIQQNQDLSSSRDDLEAAPAVPAPEPRFTPNPGFTMADDARIGELYLQLQAKSIERSRAFEAAKTAELESLFEARLEAELARRLPAELELHLAHFTPQPLELHPALA